MSDVVQKRRIGEFFQPRSWPFWGVHIAAVVGVAMLGFSWAGVILAIACYYARMFFVTAGMHRYFSHRTYKTSRFFQFILALGSGTTVQKGVLWWAANHRHHHRSSDQEDDIHSPVQGGFLWSQFGWILVDDFQKTRWDDIKDMAKYPELRWLNRHDVLPAVAFAAILYLVGGAHALTWGFFVSTTLLWHGTFTINSLSHMIGKRRYETTDDSRNNWVLALVTMGEGWHNNHHHHMNSTNQGFFWWEVDLSYYILKVLSWLGIVWDLRKPPAHIIENGGKKRRTGVVLDPVPEAAVEAPAMAKDAVKRAA